MSWDFFDDLKWNDPISAEHHPFEYKTWRSGGKEAEAEAEVGGTCRR